jgi:hypothetical protein
MTIRELLNPVITRPSIKFKPHYLAFLPAPFVLILLSLYLVVKPGFLGSDDLAYAELAADVLAGQFQLSPHHFANRFGVFVPTAVIYFFLGVGDYTTTLWPLFSAMMILSAMFMVSNRHAYWPVAALAMFLFVSNPLLLNQISYLLPDLPVALFTFLAVILLWLTRHGPTDHTKLYGAQAFCLCLTLAILTKETAIWVIYFAAVIFTGDLVRGKPVRLWLWIGCGGFVLAGSYLGFYYVATGDALFRLKGIETGHNLSLWSYAAGNAGPLFDRLLWGPIELLLQERGLFLPLALALPCLIFPGEQADRSFVFARFFSLFGIIVILGFWFGTTSLAAYNPLPLISRMLTPVIPALSIPAAYTLDQLFIRKAQSAAHYGHWGMTPVVVLVAGSLYSYCFLDNIPKFYLTMALCLSIPFFATWLGASARKSLIGFAGLCLLVALPYFAASHIAKGEFGETPYQRAERSVVLHTLTQLPLDALVITSDRAARIMRYYNSFDAIHRVRLATWEEDPFLAASAQRPFYVYFDQKRERWLAEAYGEASFKAFVEREQANWYIETQIENVSLFVAQ